MKFPHKASLELRPSSGQSWEIVREVVFGLMALYKILDTTREEHDWGTAILGPSKEIEYLRDILAWHKVPVSVTMRGYE